MGIRTGWTKEPPTKIQRLHEALTFSAFAALAFEVAMDQQLAIQDLQSGGGQGGACHRTELRFEASAVPARQLSCHPATNSDCRGSEKACAHTLRQFQTALRLAETIATWIFRANMQSTYSKSFSAFPLLCFSVLRNLYD